MPNTTTEFHQLNVGEEFSFEGTLFRKSGAYWAVTCQADVSDAIRNRNLWFSADTIVEPVIRREQRSGAR